jgi:hypothetical protein
MPDAVIHSDCESYDDTNEEIHDAETPAEDLRMFNVQNSQLERINNNASKQVSEIQETLDEVVRNNLAPPLVQERINSLFSNSSNSLSSHLASITYTIMTAPMLNDYKKHAMELS